MITTEDKVKLKDLTDKVTVIPFDLKKISEDLTKQILKDLQKVEGTFFDPKIEKETTFELRDALCVIKGTWLVIDNECVGEVVKDERLVLPLYEIKTGEDGRRSFGLFPRFNISATIGELIKDYSLPEITLTEFMGSRFAYNPRVVSNMKETLREAKKEENKRD